MKLALFLVCAICAGAGSTLAQEVAKCGDPQGVSFFPNRAPMSGKDSGWQKDGISGGLITIRRLGEGKYDVLFVDALKTIVSSVQDGGTVIGMKRGRQDAIFIVLFRSGTVETYHLIRDDKGADIYLHYTDRGTDGMVTKGSFMQGSCSTINFDLID